MQPPLASLGTGAEELSDPHPGRPGLQPNAPEEHARSWINDRPVVPMPLAASPMRSAGYHAACNHPNPEQRISILDAVQMYTRSAARLSFDEEERGTLTDGKVADFVVL